MFYAKMSQRRRYKYSHLNLDPKLADEVRAAALAVRLDMSTFISICLQLYRAKYQGPNAEELPLSPEKRAALDKAYAESVDRMAYARHILAQRKAADLAQRGTPDGGGTPDPGGTPGGVDVPATLATPVPEIVPAPGGPVAGLAPPEAPETPAEPSEAQDAPVAAPGGVSAVSVSRVAAVLVSHGLAGPDEPTVRRLLAPLCAPDPPPEAPPPDPNAELAAKLARAFRSAGGLEPTPSDYATLLVVFDTATKLEPDAPMYLFVTWARKLIARDPMATPRDMLARLHELATAPLSGQRTSTR